MADNKVFHPLTDYEIKGSSITWKDPIVEVIDENAEFITQLHKIRAVKLKIVKSLEGGGIK